MPAYGSGSGVAAFGSGDGALAGSGVGAFSTTGSGVGGVGVGS